jgi:hypothetical protein
LTKVRHGENVPERQFTVIVSLSCLDTV